MIVAAVKAIALTIGTRSAAEGGGVFVRGATGLSFPEGGTGFAAPPLVNSQEGAPLGNGEGTMRAGEALLGMLVVRATVRPYPSLDGVRRGDGVDESDARTDATDGERVEDIEVVGVRPESVGIRLLRALEE
jgi:hypothetical protein